METKEELQQEIAAAQAKLDVIDLFTTLSNLPDDQFASLSAMLADPSNAVGIALSRVKPETGGGGNTDSDNDLDDGGIGNDDPIHPDA